MPDYHGPPSTRDNDFSPTRYQTVDGQWVSTTFVYNTVAFQNQANNIYTFAQTYNAANNATQTGKQFKFKSQQDRILALIGQYNVAGCPK